jgi:hypothetical protein
LKKIHKFQKWVLELARRGFGFECLSGWRSGIHIHWRQVLECIEIELIFLLQAKRNFSGINGAFKVPSLSKEHFTFFIELNLRELEGWTYIICKSFSIIIKLRSKVNSNLHLFSLQIRELNRWLCSLS